MVVSMNRWAGKVAVVTGASAGIGAGIVDALVEHGLKVVGIARRVELIEEKSKKLSGKKGKLYAVKADISKENEILKAFQWVTDNVGAVSILINSAGIAKETTLLDGSTDDFKMVLDTNVLGICIATREAIKSMQENKIEGHIVHIGGVLGHNVLNIPEINVAPAAKHALKAMTETLRQELARLQSRIRITEVSPGTVATEMTLFNKDNSPERQTLMNSVPMLKAEDVADSVVYILSTPGHVQVHELIIQPVGQPF